MQYNNIRMATSMARLLGPTLVMQVVPLHDLRPLTSQLLLFLTEVLDLTKG